MPVKLTICWAVMQVLLSALQERRERKMLDVEEAAVAAAAAACAPSSKHNPAKGQWEFAQRAQHAALAEEQAAAASGARATRRGQHQRHGSASDKEGPVHRQAPEVTFLSCQLPPHTQLYVGSRISMSSSSSLLDAGWFCQVLWLGMDQQQKSLFWLLLVFSEPKCGGHQAFELSQRKAFCCTGRPDISLSDVIYSG